MSASLWSKTAVHYRGVERFVQPHRFSEHIIVIDIVFRIKLFTRITWIILIPEGQLILLIITQYRFGSPSRAII